MAVVTPPTIDVLPLPPDPNNRATYNALAYPWSISHITYRTQLLAVAANVYGNAVDAAASASTAATQAAIATAKAVLAAQSVVDAAAQVTLATTQANNAGTSAAAAAARLVDIEALYDQFDDRYLGAKASDPTLDNDGNPLQNGAFYINTVSGYLRAYTIAGGWVQGISAVAGVSSVNGQTGAAVIAVPVGATLFTALNAGAL